MRIAVLTSLYPGPSRPFEGVFAEQRWRGMRARGHEVSVTQPLPFAPPLARGAWGEIAALPRYEERHGIPVVRPRYLHLPGQARRNARAFARRGLRALLRGEEPDVVVADYAWPAAAAAPELRERGIPCLINGRGSDVLEVGGEAGLGAELGDYLIAAGAWCGVSDDLVGAMDRLAGVPGRGRLVPNGVDLERFQPRDRAAARRELGLSEGRLVVVCGHLIPRKDPLLALEAFRQGAGTKDRLAFLGRGPLAGELHAAMRAAGLEDRVTLRGEVPPDSLATWYAAADLLLLTSRREGRPNVVLEAMASGRPVLATDAGGTSEVLGAFVERCLVRGRDPRVLGVRLAELPGRGRLVPNGVDLERFQPRDRAAARRELGLPEGRLVVVCGHLIPRKDPRLALEVFRRGAGALDRLVFLGRGPLAEELREAIRAAGLEERVSLRGEVPPDSLATWYAAADLLLLTSRREGRPNVVLEAMACGRPVLATDAGGTSEVLGEFVERCLVPGRDPRVLGVRLAELLADPPAPEALRAAVEPLSWARSFEALERSLGEAMERMS